MKRSHLNTVTLALAALAGMLFAVSANAQDARNTAERIQDRKALRADKANVAYDAASLDRLSDLVLEWNTLRASGAPEQEISAAMDRITVSLRQDLRESALENTRATIEMRQSASEVRGDRREVRRDRRQVREAVEKGATPDSAAAKRELRGDRRDRRDDRRDRRDDARDQRKTQKLLESKRAVARDLVDLQRRIDAGTEPVKKLQNKQAALLHQYVALSQNEIKMGVREIREDRRELREDRRETREDRREKRE